MAVEVEKLIVSLEGRITKYEQQMKKAVKTTDTSARRIEGRFNAANKGLQTGLVSGIGLLNRALAGLSIAAFTVAIKSAIDRAREFGKAIAEVSTLLSDTSSIGELRQEAKDLAIAFGSAPIEQAKALYQVISAGASTAAEAVVTLTAANKLAVGGVTTIETAADGLTSVLNAYGSQVESATAVSDAMFVGMRAGKTTIDELSRSIGLVAPLASTAGVTFDQLVAAISALTKQGIRTQIAVAGVRAMIAAIVKPTSEAQKMAEKLGLQFDAAALKAKGFAGFLEEVQLKTGGSTTALAQLFGGVEALVPAMALLGNGAEDFADILEDMTGKAGETEVAFGKMEDSAAFAFDQAKAAAGDFIDRVIEATRLMYIFETAARGFARTMADETPRQEVERITTRMRELRAALDDLRDAPIVSRGAIASAEAELAELEARYHEITDAVKENEIATASAAAATASAADEQRRLTEEAEAAAEAVEEMAAQTTDTTATDAQADSINRVADALRLERDNLFRTTEEQRIYNALAAAGVQIDSEYGRVIAGLVTEISQRTEAMKDLADAIELTDKLEAEGLALTESLMTAQEQYNAVMARAQELYDAKIISLETLYRAQKLYGNELALSEGRVNKETSDANDALNDQSDAARAAQSGVSGLISDLANGESAMDSFANAILNVIDQLANLLIQQALTGLFGGGAAGGGILGGLFGGLFHEGGVVGKDKLRRRGGRIKANERFALLETGEEVLTREDPRHRFNVSRLHSGGLAGQASRMAVPAAAGRNAAAAVVPAPVVTIRNINAFDAPGFFSEAMATPMGERTMLNFVQANRGRMRAALGV